MSVFILLYAISKKIIFFYSFSFTLLSNDYLNDWTILLKKYLFCWKKGKKFSLKKQEILTNYNSQSVTTTIEPLYLLHLSIYLLQHYTTGFSQIIWWVSCPNCLDYCRLPGVLLQCIGVLGWFVLCSALKPFAWSMRRSRPSE